MRMEVAADIHLATQISHLWEYVNFGLQHVIGLYTNFSSMLPVDFE